MRALTHALNTGRLHHAYLFTGTRGVGKTTLSRILAKSLNCTGPDGTGGITATPCGKCEACQAIDGGRFVDYIEMDAASNRGVDEMAQLLEQAVYAPSNARFKVYMIDEVHMLTNHAFNSMLKTLEEPPEHVKFILATTDPQKIPVTVLSRCLQFNLKQMPPGHIVGHLANILGQEEVHFEQPALRLLAQGAHGSMRDALSLTDQAIAYAAGEVTLDSVQGMLGALDQSYLVRLLDALARQDGADLLAVADEMASRSLSYNGALQDLGTLLHRIALAQTVPAAVPADLPEYADIVRLAGEFDAEEVQLFYQIAVHGRNELGLAPDEYAGFSMTLLRMLAFRPGVGGAEGIPLAPSGAAVARGPGAARAAAAAAGLPGAAPAPARAAAMATASHASVTPGAPAGMMAAQALQAAPAAQHATGAAALPAQGAASGQYPARQGVQGNHGAPSVPAQAVGQQGAASQYQAPQAAAPAAATAPMSPAKAAIQARAASGIKTPPSRPAPPVPQGQPAQPAAPSGGAMQPSAMGQASAGPAMGSAADQGSGQGPSGPAMHSAARQGMGQGSSGPAMHSAAGQAMGQARPAQAAQPAAQARGPAPWEDAVPAAGNAPWDDGRPAIGGDTAVLEAPPRVQARQQAPDDDLPPWVTEFSDDTAVASPQADAPAPVAQAPVRAPVKPPYEYVVTPVAELDWDGNWPALAARLPLRGVAQQLATQAELIKCVPDGTASAQFFVRVPIETWRTPPNVEKLAAALTERFNRPIRVETELGPVWYTASVEAQAYREALQRAAEDTVANDPFIKSMIREFGAFVVPGSIVPPPAPPAH